MSTKWDQIPAPKRIAVVAMVALLGIAGCKHDPNVQKRKYFESGKRYEDEGKLREAAIQFSNALKVDRNYSPAHYELAKTYIQLGSMIAGYQELQRTVSLDPANIQARLDLGNILLAGGVPDRAKEQAKAVLAAQPNNADAYALLSRIAQRQGDHEQALTLIQHALQIDPNRAVFHTSLGLLQSAGADGKALGEPELRKAVDLNPKDPSARLALAAMLARNGDTQGAEKQAEASVQAAPESLQARVVLAELYMRENNQAKAEGTLLQAAKDMPDKDQPASILLRYYLQTRQVQHAESVFADLHQQHPKSTPLELEYARLLVLDNKYDQAADLLKEISKTNGNNPQVQRLNADVLLHSGRNNDALVLLQKAVGNAPDDVSLRLLLARTAAGLGKTGLVETNLRDAARLDPHNLDAARGLASLSLSRGDMDQLGQLAENTITSHPDAPDGYVWRGTVEARRQEMTQAEKDFETARQKDPNSEAANLDLGELRLAQKRVADGSALLEQVLDRDPHQIQALNSLVSLDLQAKQPEKAVARIQAQIAKSPNNLSLYTDLSALQVQLKDFAGAQASAQHALSLDKTYQPAVQLYSQAQVALGNTDGAISTWQQWLVAHPDDPRANTLLGSLEETKGDISKAMEYYKKALQLDSSQAVAANNLAVLMVDNGDNSDVALSYAQTARRALPNSPSTADTLAWVYYHKGTYSLARDLLEDAAKEDPSDAAIHFHLGMTYIKLGNKADAQSQLKKAVDLASDAPIGKQAADALSKL